MLMGGRHPVGVVFLEVPASRPGCERASGQDRGALPARARGLRRHPPQRQTALAAAHRDRCARRRRPMHRRRRRRNRRSSCRLLECAADAHRCLPPERSSPPARALPVLRVLGQASALVHHRRGAGGRLHGGSARRARAGALRRALRPGGHAALWPCSRCWSRRCWSYRAPADGGAAWTARSCSGSMGFEAEPFGDRHLPGARRARPAGPRQSIGETLAALLDDLASGKEHGERQERLWPPWPARRR